MKDRILDKVVMITGATSGIGKATAEMLSELGANLIVCGRSQSKLDDLVSKLSENTDVYSDTFDICDQTRCGQFLGEALSYFGRIDVLINCAGANFARAPVSNLDTGDLRNMLEVNLIAPFFLMQSVFNESMRERQTGTILNVLSTVCLYSNPNIGAYTAAKSGFDALVNVFRKETRNYGIKVCSIYPGGVDTDFRSNATPDYLTAQSVAESIIFMLSQEGNSALDSLTIRPMIENNFA